MTGVLARVELSLQARTDPNGPRCNDLAIVREGEGETRLAQVVKLDPAEATSPGVRWVRRGYRYALA